jgi:fatty acid desaturase
LIKKLTIGVMEPNSFTSFYSWHSEFYSVLKKRVIHRLDSRKLQRRGSIEIWIKAALLLVGFWYSLYKMYTTNSSSTSTSFLTAAAWSISMGTFAALIGTNIQHDGNHGAFSNTKLINKLAGWTMDMIGASAYTWEIQHMLGHHPYTNLLDVVEEERKGRNVDCKIEEKDQVRRERVCDLSCVRYLFDGSNVLTSYPRSICH